MDNRFLMDHFRFCVHNEFQLLPVAEHKSARWCTELIKWLSFKAEHKCLINDREIV